METINKKLSVRLFASVIAVIIGVVAIVSQIGRASCRERV